MSIINFIGASMLVMPVFIMAIAVVIFSFVTMWRDYGWLFTISSFAAITWIFTGILLLGWGVQ